MLFREYDATRDREAANRIWRETGWLEKDKEAQMNTYIEAGRAFVAEIDGEAECLVATMPGTMRYLDAEVSLGIVTAVTTSRIARKQGLAGRLTARAVATEARHGALVSALGMFEQGFYSRLGFGTGSYNHWVKFDPASLNIPVKARIPSRLTVKDAERVHKARLARLRGHGGCNVLPVEFTSVEMEGDDHFGLGYCDGPEGELTHFFWGKAKGEGGPYSIWWVAYRTPEQLLELMALIRNLGDQVTLVEMSEPPGIQIQDLLKQPFRHRNMTHKGENENSMHAAAWWQMRINDLAGCLAHTHLHGETARFNLKLNDPITEFLDAEETWRGAGGDFIVTLGPDSHAERGTASGLPTLTASVGAFTRMWLGVRSASSLAITDQLSGSQELLEQLDWALRLPEPQPGWGF